MQHFHLIGLQIDNLTRTEVAHTMEIEIRETGGLAAHGIRTFLLSDDDWCTSQEIAGSNNTILCEDQHRARTFYLPVYQIDTFDKGTAHIDEQRHEFRLVDGVGRILAEMHTTLQQLIGNLSEVVDLRHRHHRITS